MRLYETAFLIAPNLPEEENEAFIDQMAQVVSKKKGKMVNVDKWGKKKLAYPINKFKEAYYVFFLYQGEPELPAELERRFKQTEAVIRFLTVKREETPPPPPKTRKSTPRVQEEAPEPAPEKTELQKEEAEAPVEKNDEPSPPPAEEETTEAKKEEE